MTNKTMATNHVNTPLPYEKGSMAVVPSNNPAIPYVTEHESLFSSSSVLPPHRPSSADDDIKAESVVLGDELARSPEHESKKDKGHKSVAHKSAAGDAKSSKAKAEKNSKRTAAGKPHKK